VVHLEFQECGKGCDALTVCESKPGTITLSEPDARPTEAEPPHSTETKPFHLSGRTRGSASCSQGAGGQAKHLGREIVTQPNVRDLDDVQEPARKDVGLLLSHVLPRWCVVPVTHGLSLRLHTDPGSANLGEERGRVQSRLERVTFRPIALDNDIKILNRDN